MRTGKYVSGYKLNLKRKSFFSINKERSINFFVSES